MLSGGLWQPIHQSANWHRFASAHVPTFGQHLLFTHCVRLELRRACLEWGIWGSSPKIVSYEPCIPLILSLTGPRSLWLKGRNTPFLQVKKMPCERAEPKASLETTSSPRCANRPKGPGRCLARVG